MATTRAQAETEAPDLDERAHALLAANTRHGRKDGRTYRFTIPSAGDYPFQWFWDSCFHAIVWARYDRERAADELRSLLAWQRPDGFVPHVVFWDQSKVAVSQCWHYLEGAGLPGRSRPLTSECVQPPVIAQAVERIGGPFAQECVPALGRFYRYLAERRDPDGDGLVSIVNQFESGLDFSPVYSEASGLRLHDPLSVFLSARRAELVNKLLRFDLDRIFRLTDHHIEDVLFNTVYADGLRALARLADAAGDASLALWARDAAARTTAALVERCWDPEAGLFFGLLGRRERRLTQPSVSSLLPLLLADLPDEIAATLVERLTDERTFWTPWPVASVPRNDPSFRRDSRIWGVRFIWRGPASLNTNWFLVQGLRRHGQGGVADELVARSRELVERGGLNEFYDPIDGRPVGADDFGWATLVTEL